MVYGCDGPWWKNKGGLPEFKGVKLTHDTGVCAEFEHIHKVEIVDKDRLLFDEPGTVGSGGNSGFQALNLAAQFGSARILLIGFDMHGTNGLHWYGRNVGRGMNNPDAVCFTRFRKSFSSQAAVLRQMNIEVINTSEESALTCFPQMTVESALHRWGL